MDVYSSSHNKCAINETIYSSELCNITNSQALHNTKTYTNLHNAMTIRCRVFYALYPITCSVLYRV